MVDVPWDRLAGWFERFEVRHTGTTWAVAGDRFSGVSPDGGGVLIDVPFGPLPDPSPAGLVAHCARPWRLGLVLVRRGGFAVGYVVGSELVASKVGQRHVQGKTKAGGWSQHRFARRRDNQARMAFEAAAEHAHRILGPVAGSLDLVALGGDRAAVDAVLAAPILAALADRPRRWLGGLPDPRRQVLLDAVGAARSARMRVTDPPAAPVR